MVSRARPQLSFIRRRWRVPVGAPSGATHTYTDIPGYCKSAPLDEVRKHGHYVGAEAQAEDAEPFAEKMQRLTATLREQQAEGAKLDTAIAANLKELGYGA